MKNHARNTKKPEARLETAAQKLQFKTRRLSAGFTDEAMFEFVGSITSWMFGIHGFQLKVLNDFLEGKHIQIRNMQVELDCTQIGDQTIQVVPTLIFDNEAEGGALNTAESYVQVTGIAAAEAFDTAFPGAVSMTMLEDVSGSRNVTVPDGHDQQVACLSGFHMRFQSEARELKNTLAATSVESSGSTATVSGEADMNGKSEFALSTANVDVGLFTANADSLRENYAIVRMTGLKANQPAVVPGSSGFKNIYPILTRFYTEFANDDHREVWYIQAAFDIAQGTNDFQIVPRIDMIGGDNQVGQTGPDSSIDLVIFAERE